MVIGSLGKQCLSMHAWLGKWVVESEQPLMSYKKVHLEANGKGRIVKSYIALFFILLPDHGTYHSQICVSV